MNTNTRDLSRYKKILRELKITHQQVADYIGHTREHVTLFLNGVNPPLRVATHISQEIEEIIADKRK